MKKHFRLWAVVMTSLLLVGVVAASAAGTAAHWETSYIGDDLELDVGSETEVMINWTRTGDDADATTKVKATSSNTDVVTVTPAPEEGIATTATDGGAVKFTITAVAEGTATITVTPGESSFDVTVGSGSSGGGEDMFDPIVKDVFTRLTGALAVGTTFNDVISVDFGTEFQGLDEKVKKTLKWKATNLPAGLKLEQVKDDLTKATLKGTLTTATKDPLTNNAKHTWTITASYKKDSRTTVTSTKSGTAIVWAMPDFKTKTDKPISVKTGKNGIKFSITMANPVHSWSAKIGEPSTNLFGVDGWSIPPGENNTAGTTMIQIDKAATAKKPNTLVFTGSFDRVPSGTIPLVVTATNPIDGQVKTETFAIEVKGVAPKFGKGDFTFEKGEVVENEKSFDLTAGDPDINWRAYIDDKTMQKLTGDKTAQAIVLYSGDATPMPDSTTGLFFAPIAPLGDDSSKSRFVYNGTTAVALKKLPVTVEAWNVNVNPDEKKHSKGKATITIDGTDPSWTYTYVEPANTPADNGDGLESGDTPEAKPLDDKDNKLELDIKAGEAFSGLKVTPAGDWPLAYTIKPESKNGIEAKWNETSTDIVFSGTADSVTKDTAVKFSLEAKNPSTGKTAKATVTINILPTPAAKVTDKANDYEIVAKSVTVGKAAKVAPKLSLATNKEIEWEIKNVTVGDAVVDLADYGLELNSAKGEISGTTTKATGKTNPLVITMVAHGKLDDSEPFTVTLPIVGEKVQLAKQTTPVKFTLGTETGDSVAIKVTVTDNTLSTNIAANANTANITWEVDASKVKEADDLFDLTPVTDSGTTKATVTLKEGKTLKVAKKISVPVKFTNYGTESTGTFTVEVVGDTPAISGNNTIAVEAGKKGTLSLTASNSAVLSDKLKWEISVKPGDKDIKASIKADKDTTTATLEVSIGAKVTTASDKVTVKLTDTVTALSQTKEITITNSSVTPEPDPVTPETPTSALKGEEKVVGEGEVTMGAQRTLETLTAKENAQIKALEAQGYIIAAVLPEIEVTAGGQYDFEVELDADGKVRAGAELVWFAFASKPTTDDEIVEFEDLEHNEIKVVPETAEGHEYPVVIAWPWLNEGTKYAPVIAVKANADEADAMTEDGIKEKADEAKADEAKEEK